MIRPEACSLKPEAVRRLSFRPSIVLLALLGGAATLAAALTAASSEPHPNLLLITLDTVRADHLGAYGDRTATTPALDQLARDGVRFADATTQAPLTGPAHAALLTGVYPARFGVRDNATTVLPDEALTLAERLRGAGYRTGAFVGAFILDRAYGFAQGFDVFDAQFDRFEGGGQKLEAQRPAGRVVAPALRWLGGLPADAPFFAWVHLYDAHAPYEPPPPFRARFRARPYDGEIAYVDSAVGRLTAQLAARGLLDRTLVVAVADHGESLGEHGEDTHGLFLYEGVLHIPWIMRLPAREHAGLVVSEQVRAIDLVPTLLDLLKIPRTGAMDGESLLGVLGGSPRSEPPVSYAETYYPRFHFGWSELRSVRAGEFKFIDAPKPELYNVRTDRAEARNLVGARASLASGLGSELQKIAGGFGPVRAAAVPQPDPETLARLRSLGYVGLAGPSSTSGRGPDPKDLASELPGFGDRIERALRDIREGRPDAAIVSLKRLLEISPGAYDLHLFLGDAYRRKGDQERALGEYLAAGELNRSIPEPRLAAADVLLAQGKLEEAGRRIADAAAVAPASYEVAVGQGQLAEAYHRDQEALAQYQRAVATAGADPRPRAFLANLALRLGMLDTAEREFGTLLKMGFRAAATHYGLGLVAEKRGQRAKAIAEYRQALRLDAGLTAAREALKRLGGAAPPSSGRRRSPSLISQERLDVPAAPDSAWGARRCPINGTRDVRRQDGGGRPYRKKPPEGIPSGGWSRPTSDAD